MAATPVENKKPQIEIPPNHPSKSNNAPTPLKFPYLPGVFLRNNRPAVKSTNTGGFNNAKAASMLERGLIKKDIHSIRKGNLGILAIHDGPEIEVSVEKGGHYNMSGIYVYTFKDTSDKIFDMPHREKWEFYTDTTPVPFVHRKSRRSLRSRKARKTRRQKGGFYPSVYGGIAGAKMLTPLIARQMMRMYDTSNKTRKSKSKKTLKNKRA